MKPTHLNDGHPAITFRPAISVTGCMIQAAIVRLLHDKAKKIDEKTVTASLQEQLLKKGESIISELDGPFHDVVSLAESFTHVLFPGFFPDPGEDAMSRHRAAVEAAKPGKKTEKTEDDTVAPPADAEPKTATKRRGRPAKKEPDGSAPGPMAGAGMD